MQHWTCSSSRGYAVFTQARHGGVDSRVDVGVTISLVHTGKTDSASFRMFVRRLSEFTRWVDGFAPVPDWMRLGELRWDIHAIRVPHASLEVFTEGPFQMVGSMSLEREGDYAIDRGLMLQWLHDGKLPWVERDHMRMRRNIFA